MLTIERLREVLIYEPSTGIFRWTSGRHKGVVAGWVQRHGHRTIVIDGKNHYAHRLAWFWHFGSWPTAPMLDHINRKPDDNRVENLREANSAQNQANRKARKDSSSGLRGVRRLKHSGKWAASIQIGSYDTPEEAYAAYCILAKLAYGEFAAVTSEAA